MYLEIQVALNFLISFLYNKLPRRRVNQFGEELELALKNKFAGHWYPEEPAKGSAYRCLKTANPLDPVFEIAARNCGLELSDVQEYLPNVTIWIEPGEVSYRMSEKSPVKLLYSENEGNLESKRNVQSFNASEQVYAKENESSNYNNLNNSTANNTNLGQNANEQPEVISNGSPGSNSSNISSNSSSADSGFTDVDITQQRKVRAFNPEAQCFKPIDSASLITSFNNNQSATNQYSTSGSTLVNNYSFTIQNMGSSNLNGFNQKSSTYSNVSSNYFNNQNNSTNPLKSPSNQTTTNVLPTAGFKQTQTMTTAQFAQTKFGSTKLKTTNNSSTGAICGINGTTKRNNYSNRMSPTEFSNYIKQRALLQQQQGMNTLSQSLNGHQLQVPLSSGNSNNGGSYNLFNSLSPQPSRSISPISNQDNFLLMAAAAAVSNGQQQTTNQVTNNLIRNQLVSNSSPISANNVIQSNSANNSICSSLSSNSNSGSLKLMLNNQQTNQNLLSPSSAPAGDNLLSDINYLSELFNTSLSPILNSSTSLNSSLNATMNTTNSISKSNAASSLNHFNGPSFLEMNSAANSFGNFGNDFLQPSQQQLNRNLAVGSKTNEQQFNQPDINNNNQTPDNNQPQNQQNSSPKSNDKQFDSSYSMSNGIYPNQYQHLLVAN